MNLIRDYFFRKKNYVLSKSNFFELIKFELELCNNKDVIFDSSNPVGPRILKIKLFLKSVFVFLI